MRNLSFLIFLFMSFQTMAMQSLEELYKEHSAKEKADLYRNQYFLETMLRCSAASFYMVGGDDPEIDNLGDFFRNMAFGFAVIIDAKEKDGKKTQEEVRNENQILIDEYFKKYEDEGYIWYEENGYPEEDTEPSELFSEFFKNDMKYCADIYEILKDYE